MERYTALSAEEKTARRKRGQANFVYIRYADDFTVLCNGSKSEAEGLKEELSGFLREHLRLTLSKEKTKVTHLNDGFKFLGFWIQRRVGSKGMTTKVLIPREAVDEVIAKITRATNPSTYPDSLNAKIRALNRIIGGWCRYYQYTSKASSVFRLIGHEAFWQTAHWMGRKFNISMPEVMRRYCFGNQLGTKDCRLYKAYEEFPSLHYTGRFLKPNPYTTRARIRREELPSETYWIGYERRPGMADLRPAVLTRDEFKCRTCGESVTPDAAHVDHIRPVRRFKRPVSANGMTNLQTLCTECHGIKTEKGRQRESRMSAKVCAMSRTARIATKGGRSSRQMTPRRTTYLDLKGGRDSSMLLKRGAAEDVYVAALQRLRDRVRAGLPQSQSPGVELHTRR
jgi:RNA-directed DNA polymerase